MKIQTTEVDNLCVIHTPSSFNKTSNTETRNKIGTQGQTCDQSSEEIAQVAPDSKGIQRAESVKNSRRYYKRKQNMTQARHPTTILSSYLPLKNYMVKEK